jgi:hypothetical protein
MKTVIEFSMIASSREAQCPARVGLYCSTVIRALAGDTDPLTLVTTS